MAGYQIVDKGEVAREGGFSVMEGDVIFDEDMGEVTMCWVEKEGTVVSSFSDIDYAFIRAKMLDHAEQTGQPPLPELSGGIDIVRHEDRYTILTGFFGTPVYWVVGRSGSPVSDFFTDLNAFNQCIKKKWGLGGVGGGHLLNADKDRHPGPSSLD